jgi:hypothetical protein
MKMWAYIIGEATIFGAIVTLTAFINGRMTRRYIGKLIVEENKNTRELIKEENRLTRDMLKRLSEQHETMIKILETTRNK